MLSSRGQKYAKLDLAAGYTKSRPPLYDKEKHPEGLISLPNAENFPMQNDVLEYITTKCIPALDTTSISYYEGPFGSTRLRTAMSSFLNTNFSPNTNITPDQISFVGGVTALNELLAACLTEHENDALLLGMPIYGTFAVDLQSTTNCKLVYTPFGNIDQFSSRAVDQYEIALQDAQKDGINIKGLVICNPHNPLGRCYTRDTLEALIHFCGEHRIHLVSDEIYAMSVYHTDDQHPGFASILSIDIPSLIDEKLVHVMYGMAKDFAPGLKLGCLISKNAELTKAVRSLARFRCASQFTDAIASTMLSDTQFYTSFLKKSQSMLHEHQLIATHALSKVGISHSPNPNAGFFLWINLSACLRGTTWGDEVELQQQLYEAGVEMESGRRYHDENPGSFRLVISVEKDILVEGLKRIVTFYNATRKEY